MKKYEVHSIRKSFLPGSSEQLAKETESFLNTKLNAGYELIHISFHLDSADSGYIYSYLVIAI